jgi:(p)ppGpp synthase/HD superfamily hydrolase
MEQWEKLIYDFSKKKYERELDDDGKTPYFDSHILKVVAILRCVTSDQNIITAAYLHDTIEDSGTTYQEIAELFGGRVAGLVYEVTHEGKGRENYYFPRLKSREAIMLKFADRLSNISRMTVWPEDKQADYLRRSKFWKTE